MHGADVQDRQGDSEARRAILAEVYSTLTPEPPAPIAATRRELIEKLTRVRDTFKWLQEQYDPDGKDYETKLFMFYDDLLEIARGFDPAEYLKDRAKINIPRRYKVENFFDLNLTEYSDIIDLWDDLWDILEQVSSTDRQELVRSLQGIRKKVSAVPHLTCERVALCALVDIWLPLLGRDREAPPPTIGIDCETTILPAKYECALRLTVKSDDVLEYELKVIPPSEEIKVLGCQPQSVKIGPTRTAEVECKIESEVDGKQNLVLVLSSRELEKSHEQELSIEFYDPKFVRPSNPYPTFGSANPFPFPSRNSLRQEVVETIQNFFKEKDGEFLAVELRGIPRSGRSVLAGEVCRVLKSHSGEEIATFERCTGDCEECKHELQMLLKSANMIVLIVHCRLAERIPNRQETYSELFEVAKTAGATKAIFLCELPEEPGRDYVVGPLTEADIKSLIEQVGLVGGGPGDTEIRGRLEQGSSFLHFDARVVDRISEFGGNYPELAIQACDKIADSCSDQECIYVSAEMAEAIIKQICQSGSVKGELSQSIYSRIAGEERGGVEERQQVLSALAELAKDPYDRVQFLELQEILLGRNVKFDPLRVIRDLEKNKVIVEDDYQEYRFGNPLYWVIVREFPI